MPVEKVRAKTVVSSISVIFVSNTVHHIFNFLRNENAHSQQLFAPPTSSTAVYWVKGFRPLATASVDKPV